MYKIGHRGAPFFAPENTLASFEKAIELGVDMIEFDVHVCASNQVVVIHDETIDRTTNGHGYVNQLSLDYLKSLDAGNGQRIPTLNEALNFINQRVAVNIELKGENTALPVAQMLNEIMHNGWHEHDFLISSFDYTQLKQTRLLLPQIRIGILTEKMENHHIALAQQLHAYSIHVDKIHTTATVIQIVHEQNLKIFSYTVNDIARMQALKTMGIDGIFSDNPALFPKIM